MDTKSNIIAVISIIVTIILALYGYQNYYPKDFSISVNPMEGKVQQQGTLSTTVTVEGGNGYDKMVSLSAIQKSSDIVVSFTPPLGGALPSYTSNVLINVGSNAQIGIHDIEIIGIGADGKNHNTYYTLNIIPNGPTPTPTSTSTLTPTPTPPSLDIKIKSPAEGEKVPTNILISGTFSEEIQNDQYMWVVVHPYDSMGWWPQLGQIKPFRGLWNTQAVIGQGKDTGKEFDIAVILVNKESNQKYLNYIEEGKTTGNYPEIQLPQDAITYDRITVTRK